MTASWRVASPAANNAIAPLPAGQSHPGCKGEVASLASAGAGDGASGVRGVQPAGQADQPVGAAGHVAAAGAVRHAGVLLRL